MGRNRKGRQCGGYSCKKERFVLLQRWQQEVDKISNKNALRRKTQHRLADQQRRAQGVESVRRRVKLDILADWTNARLKDDYIERIKREGALSIASEIGRARVRIAAGAVYLQNRAVI
ncbi:uncharacterized protein PHALS_14255 [Plasmopara halstedii]|uniref:Uncharacterized protein n=1 Tax=Plasmopara halstedii TaxID=4781 RepID=A0A0P1AR66_PLAHL|nr:uncharacterized protein PHALS_14255 [Plasmopara halstedii]CEG43980.1 hypothetical protein PHALS_14255 [Plasmopara halstedii]|eukprot:XP_024580349.1 hypothetical protein PHALS_14255 [Plasmopara halstedii]